ncbi:MAG: CBASS oligonucleotide cyclase [Nitrospira sp.]|nr:CBASS oligonucleotide cyclase [Nitrospira sp.]MDE0505636.1 CBASS oligonucleotide cyclase [Candidatus Poribacteria bacterium]
MSREHIDHKHIVDFADRRVNLHRDDAKEYREQVVRLREKLEKYVAGNPDFELRKILLSGSLAKHTALRTLNDIDVAVYIASAPEDVKQLMRWLAEKLRTAFPNFSPEQVEVQTYSVRIDFRGSGLSVDVVPVFAERGDGDWGYLVSQEDGRQLRTNITLHKDFIRKRRKNNPHYAQVVRLLKWWVRTRKEENEQFGFKSFMVELALAKLVDNGESLDDYPEALLSFFDHIARTNFSDMIVFDDYPEAGTPTDCGDPIRVFDPVNAKNNVGRKYSDNQRNVIVDACIDAGDAIEAALRARTKTETLDYWRKVFGSSFSD